MSNVAQFIQPGRQLPSWIAGFLQHTDSIQSPEIHRKWAAITAVAGALERKVWVVSQGKFVYPNIYCFLVGPPGTGKTRALMECWDLWNCLTEHNIAEISLTKAALIDRLAASERVMHRDNMENFHSLLIASPELGALLPSYDSDFMNTLTHLYDGYPYTEKRRSAKTEFEPIARPNINLVACTTPGFLVSSLPASAWNEGFLSRVCIAYSGEIVTKKLDLLNEAPRVDSGLERALKHDLQEIAKQVGKMEWTRPAANLVEKYNDQKFDLENLPEPKHPRLMHYNTRRPVHFLKLCMVFAADRGARTIDLPDVESALGALHDLEVTMPEVFLGMSSGGDAQVISDCHHWVATESVTKYALEGAGVPAHLVHEFLMTRAPATHVHRIFEVMTSSGMLTTHSIPGGYIVKARSKL